ncbi:hypothetical protein M2352_003704 [Azospirillum fermentarium]|uniref:hypothetical protein n=1 Tax=Azospirillum fermentarium TaxID=1233114 RepID=UPI002226BC77|nr:hypothetical protein [Azospirillum fermentarium]MCW2248070.1 hypothetical protein [Azospirillum fermentarium]
MSKDNLLSRDETQTNPMKNFTLTQNPPFDLDVEKYRPEIAEFNLTEEQEIEFLQTLWSIMYSFVELGFSYDICAHLTDNFNEVAKIDNEDDRLK